MQTLQILRITWAKSQSFNTMAIEMWINERGVADFDLDECEFIHLDQQHKAGGGVAFFGNLQWKQMKLSFIYLIISCVYRTPSSNIELVVSKITLKQNF